jgi:uncharacterized tellurite resistance protein B-like protein
MSYDLQDAWTPAHDLALVGIMLAYGTDGTLDDRELDALTAMLRRWHGEADEQQVREVVMEAAAVFFEDQGRREVRRAVADLHETFSDEERQQALRDMMRVAEADGILLEGEQGLISLLADAWELKTLGARLLDASVAGAHADDAPATWTLLHELGLVYVILAHSTDNDLSRPEIQVIVRRLQEWHPDLDEDEARHVVRDVLQFYADAPNETVLAQTVGAIKAALPPIQRLAVLDDLYAIAYADGTFMDEERKMIHALADAWEVPIRLNGRAEMPETDDAEEDDEEDA